MTTPKQLIDELRFQCRERLMGDCYLGFCFIGPGGCAGPVSVPRTADGGLLPARTTGWMRSRWPRSFQCRERLMGDCYLCREVLVWRSELVSVPRTADGGLLLALGGVAFAQGLERFSAANG